MNKFPSLCAFVALSMVGCATTAPPAYEGAQSITPAARQAILEGHPDQVTCWREQPTRSHIPEKSCATKEEVAAKQKQDQQSLFNMQTQGQAKNVNSPPLF